MVLIEQDMGRCIVARTWAGACYNKQQRFPSHEEGQKPSHIRLRRAVGIAGLVLELPLSRATDARGRAEVGLDDLEHDEGGSLMAPLKARGLDSSKGATTQHHANRQADGADADDLCSGHKTMPQTRRTGGRVGWNDVFSKRNDTHERTFVHSPTLRTHQSTSGERKK